MEIEAKSPSMRNAFQMRGGRAKANSIRFLNQPIKPAVLAKGNSSAKKKRRTLSQAKISDNKIKEPELTESLTTSVISEPTCFRGFGCEDEIVDMFVKIDRVKPTKLKKYSGVVKIEEENYGL